MVHIALLHASEWCRLHRHKRAIPMMRMKRNRVSCPLRGMESLTGCCCRHMFTRDYVLIDRSPAFCFVVLTGQRARLYGNS
jgi:hypothetical protein